MIRAFHVINSLGAGGAESLLLQLCRHLPDHGVEPVVASLLPPGFLSGEFKRQGTRTVHLARSRSERPLVPVRLFREMRKQRPDIVHTHLVWSGVLGKLAGRALGKPILTTRQYTAEERQDLPYRLEDVLTRWVNDRVIAVSNQMQQYLIDAGIAKPSRTVVMHNAIDMDPFRVLQPDYRAEPPLIGTVGRMDLPKGHDTFLRAVAELRRNRSDIRAVIVGDGVLRPQLEGLRSELGLDGVVEFPGRQTASGVRGWLERLRVFVLSSDWEALPLVLIEASAAGLPIVSTRVGGTSEIVMDGQTGILVPARDSRSLARRVLELLENPELAANLGHAARERAFRHFDIRDLAERTATLYREVLAERAGRRIP